jgi:zinc transporter
MMVPDESGLLFSAQLQHANTGETHRTDTCQWRHMCALQPGTRRLLEDELHLDQHVVDAMLASGTRPRILVREEGVMINLRGVNLNDRDRPEDMISLRIWIDEHNVVTCRRRDLRAVEEVIDLFAEGKGPATAGQFVTLITTRMFDRMAPFIEELERCVAVLEEAFETGGDDDVADDTALIRRRGSIYRRHIVPQKEILERLQVGQFAWLTEEDSEGLIESHDQVIRYTELLTDIRERTQILNEELRSQQADRLNRTAYLFSVAATIFLPLSFLTGLMGINVAGMPGTDYRWGFWLFSALCIVLVGVQIVVFRKKRWF